MIGANIKKLRVEKTNEFVWDVKIVKGLSFFVKNTEMVYHRATMMPYCYSEDQNKHFEYLINIQGPTETEKHTQNARVFRFFSNYLKGD